MTVNFFQHYFFFLALSSNLLYSYYYFYYFFAHRWPLTTLKCGLHLRSQQFFFSTFMQLFSFLTQQLRPSNIRHHGLYRHSFFRVVRQPPRGAAKSSLRPKTSALTPWLPLSASSPSQGLSFQTFSNKQQVSTCDGRWFIWPGIAVTNIQRGGLQGGG